MVSDAGVSAISGLYNLESLELWSNDITAKGFSTLSNLPQLRSLDIGFVALAKPEVGALTKLKQLINLDVIYCKIPIDSLEMLGKLKQLCTLNLQTNDIDAGGITWLSELKNLVSLDLRNNYLDDKSLGFLSDTPKITTLNLEGNNIGDTGAHEIAKLSRLINLDLSYNNISESGCKAFENSKKIQTLNLSNNNVSNEGAKIISFLPGLTSLHLSSCGIGNEGAADLAKLDRLSKLDISENPINALPNFSSNLLLTLNLNNTEISDLSPLKKLIQEGLKPKWSRNTDQGIFVEGCPLKYPPPEIVKQGHQAILNYLQALQTQGVDQIFEAKMLVVGHGGTGKTSLIRRLYRPDLPLPTEDETTKGIHIQRINFPLSNKREFRLNVWDFGGQQIYHATHQFFLTKRSLYVLLDDTRRDCKTIQDESFKFWLEAIEALSDSSPVLIFQNEKGGRSKAIDEAGIKFRFPNVKGIYRGDLNNTNGAKKLRPAIEHFSQELSHIGEEVPSKWLSIRSDIEEISQTQPYISQQAYFDIYRKHLPFNHQEALHLSRYLHDLGVFLHFQDDHRLSKIVILQNHWVTDAVFRIIDDEIIKKNQGRFGLVDCMRGWSPSDYEEMRFELISLMEKFELCYALPGNEHPKWLVPQLLPPSTPAALNNWEQPGDINLWYRYEFLPKGMISRLMVRMNNLVLRPDLAWNRGVLFEKRDTQLLAQIIGKGNDIFLRARGPDAKKLIGIISSDLDAINLSFNGLDTKVHKWISCTCKSCINSATPHFFEETQLLRRKENGKFKVECDISYSEVSVHELLDGVARDPITHNPPIKFEPGTAPSTISDPREPLTVKPTEGHTSSMSPKKTVGIFLASSKDLIDDRNDFELYVRQLNDIFLDNGIYFKVIRWENSINAMSSTRMQDEYNKSVKSCEIFVSLFDIKAGKYTEEEFDVAHACFKETGRPHIYTFFKEVQVSPSNENQATLTSLWNFQEKLKNLGHFYTNYSSIAHLKQTFRDQLDKLPL